MQQASLFSQQMAEGVDLGQKKVPALRLRAAPVKEREEFRLGRMQKVIHGTVVANW